jgi:hypothetical protein
MRAACTTDPEDLDSQALAGLNPDHVPRQIRQGVRHLLANGCETWQHHAFFIGGYVVLIANVKKIPLHKMLPFWRERSSVSQSSDAIGGPPDGRVIPTPGYRS